MVSTLAQQTRGAKKRRGTGALQKLAQLPGHPPTRQRLGMRQCSAATGTIYLHSVVSRNSATIAPLMTKPRTPAMRSRLSTIPSRLRMNPNGAAAMTVSPPRAEMGDPQPGLHSHMSANAARAPSEQSRPRRPNAPLGSVVGWIGITGGSFIVSFSELHLHRFARRSQWCEVKLHLDGYFLAVQVFGYSP
jgi:hypothetical protein